MQEVGLSHSLHKLESCINDLKDWFTGSKLMLNTNKTEFIVFTSPRNQVKVNMEECVMHIGGDIIKPSKCVRDLGSYLDSNLSMDSHINMVIRSVYGQLRTIGKIRKFLDTDACATAINSLVTSRLDYNNYALLFGVPEKSLRRLQIRQNQAARILAKVDCHEHITPDIWPPTFHGSPLSALPSVYQFISCHTLGSTALALSVRGHFTALENEKLSTLCEGKPLPHPPQLCRSAPSYVCPPPPPLLNMLLRL